MNILFNSGASREAQPDWCHYRRNWQHCHQDDHPTIFMNISAWSFPGEKESLIRWSGNCHQRKTSHLFLIIKDVTIVFIQFVYFQRLQNFFTPQDCRTEKVRIVWNSIHKFLECLWFSFLLKDYFIFPCWLLSVWIGCERKFKFIGIQPLHPPFYSHRKTIELFSQILWYSFCKLDRI